MLVPRLLILLCCLAATVRPVATALRTLRDARRRRLLLRCRPTDDGAADTGISVLCSGCGSSGQVEQLLRPEYARYETVLALDAESCPELFRTLRTRYRMIRVNPPCSGELPARAIRGLYRSRQRGYRRLVLVDRRRTAPCDDFDAAAEAAAHDYLLPLREGCLPLPRAVERLTAELAASPAPAPELIVSRLGEPLLLVNRRTVLREGGFTPHTGHSVPRARRRTLYAALAFRPDAPDRFRRRSNLLCSALLLAAAGVCAAGDPWAAAVPAASALAVRCSALATAALARDDTPPRPRPGAARRLRIRRLRRLHADRPAR